MTSLTQKSGLALMLISLAATASLVVLVATLTKRPDIFHLLTASLGFSVFFLLLIATIISIGRTAAS